MKLISAPSDSFDFPRIFWKNTFLSDTVLLKFFGLLYANIIVRRYSGNGLPNLKMLRFTLHFYFNALPPKDLPSYFSFPLSKERKAHILEIRPQCIKIHPYKTKPLLVW